MRFDRFFRKIPSFKGKLRLAAWLFDRSLKDVHVTTKYGRFVLPNLRDNQYFELYIKGSYEPDLIRYIIKALPENGYFVDVGANIGSITIPVAKARPDVTVLALEALPYNFAYLQKNVRLNNLKNVYALNVCCSNKNGEIKKFYSHDTLKGSSSFHSLHSDNFEELITKTLDQQLAELGIGRVDILKIDTEGSEALIFQGSTILFSTSRPAVLFEFNDSYENAIEGLHPGDSQRFLVNAGYSIYDFDKYPDARPLAEVLTKGSGEFLAKPLTKA